MECSYPQIEVLGVLKRAGGRCPYEMIERHLISIGLTRRCLAEKATRQILTALQRERRIRLETGRSRLQTVALTDRELPEGICRKCGCTELSGCDWGCAWTDETKTLCDQCT